jgi:chitodextrinase
VEYYANNNLVAVSTSSPFSFTWNAYPGNYTLYAKAYSAYGYNATSTKVNFTVNDTTPPLIPANLCAPSIFGGHVILSWSASTDNVGVTGYRICRNGSFLKNVTNTSLDEFNLTPYTNYTYTVQAYDAAGNLSGKSSLTLTTPPAAPTNLTASNITSNSVNLSWSSSTGAIQYKIICSSTVTTASTTYTNTGLTPGTTYQIKYMQWTPTVIGQIRP